MSKKKRYDLYEVAYDVFQRKEKNDLFAIMGECPFRSNEKVVIGNPTDYDFEEKIIETNNSFYRIISFAHSECSMGSEIIFEQQIVKDIQNEGYEII